MKHSGKHCWWLVVLLLILGLQTSYATSEIPGPLKGIKLEPLTDLTTEEPVRMSLIFFPKGDYGNTLSFEVVGTNGLVTIGPDRQTIPVNEDGNFATEFQIRIPDNDTSSLMVRVLPLSNYTSQKCWFVTTEDTVEYWKDHPRMYNGPFRSDPPTGRRGWIIPGEFPDLDSIYGIPPDMIHPDYRPDSTPKRQFPSYTDAEIEAAVLERRRQEMREFEKTPLTGAGTQWIKIGDTMWTRRYGETKFRVAEPITDLEAHHQAMRDSLLAIPPGTMYDVLYQVKDTEQVATLRKHIDNLEPTRRADVYRCRISKGLIDMLEKRYRLTPAFVDQCPESLRELFDSEPSPDSGDSEPEGRLDGPDKGTEIFYSENYENGWPPSDTAGGPPAAAGLWDLIPPKDTTSSAQNAEAESIWGRLNRGPGNLRFSRRFQYAKTFFRKTNPFSPRISLRLTNRMHSSLFSRNLREEPSFQRRYYGSFPLSNHRPDCR